MKIFIYEHICGGGLAGEKLPAKLVAQGEAMMAAAIKDFAAAGHDVATTLDNRIEMDLPPCRTTPIANGSEIHRVFLDAATQADTTVVIAPESDHILERWLSLLETHRLHTLGCRAEVAKLCGDKIALCEHLKIFGIPTPDAAAFHPNSVNRWPAVVKPIDGAGCELTFLCQGPDDLADIEATDMIWQPYHPGTPVSCSAIVRDSDVVMLPPGKQTIDIQGRHMMYHGGALPLTGDGATRATALALRAINSIAGLGGFVGVDMVLGDTPRDDCVVEINPRMTVSYVALRQLTFDNLADVMLGQQADLSWNDQDINYDATGQTRSRSNT